MEHQKDDEMGEQKEEELALLMEELMAGQKEGMKVGCWERLSVMQRAARTVQSKVPTKETRLVNYSVDDLVCL